MWTNRDPLPRVCAYDSVTDILVIELSSGVKVDVGSGRGQ